jgi:hypothetical protein
MKSADAVSSRCSERGAGYLGDVALGPACVPVLAGACPVQGNAAIVENVNAIVVTFEACAVSGCELTTWSVRFSRRVNWVSGGQG